jgi:hypothetical protein
MPAATPHLVPVRDLLDQSDRPEGYVAPLFRLAGFASATARKPMYEAWAAAVEDLPIGAALAAGAAEERVEAFYAPRHSEEWNLAMEAMTGMGPEAVEPTLPTPPEGMVNVWEQGACLTSRSKSEGGSAALRLRDLPVGGWLWQGHFGCERLRVRTVPAGGPDHRMAVSNSASAARRRR